MPFTFFDSPNVESTRSKIFTTRCLQLILSGASFAFLFDGYTSPGWWLNLDLPYIFGAIVFVLTDFMCVIYVVQCVRGVRTRGGSPWTRLGTNFRYTFRILLDIVFAVLWLTLFILMWLPKGKDFRNTFEAPPLIIWGVGSAFAMLLVFTFILSIIFLNAERLYLIDHITRDQRREFLGAIPLTPL